MAYLFSLAGYLLAYKWLDISKSCRSRPTTEEAGQSEWYLYLYETDERPLCPSRLLSKYFRCFAAIVPPGHVLTVPTRRSDEYIGPTFENIVCVNLPLIVYTGVFLVNSDHHHSIRRTWVRTKSSIDIHPGPEVQHFLLSCVRAWRDRVGDFLDLSNHLFAHHHLRSSLQRCQNPCIVVR